MRAAAMKWRIGLTSVIGWSQRGIASIGVMKPDRRIAGSMKKRPPMKARCWVRAVAAISRPSDSVHRR